MRQLRLLLAVTFMLSLGLLVISVPLAMSQGDLTLRFNDVSSDNFPEIQTIVTVVDSHGIPVAGLDQAAFQAAEEGQQVPLSSVVPFTNPDVPIAVLLVIDGSGSMAGAPLNQAKQSAIQFLDGLGPNDQAAVIAFGNTVDLNALDPAKEADFTTDKEALKALINGLTTEAGQVTTPLYDAIFKSVRLTANHPAGNRVVVIFTDGREGDAQGQPVSTLSREAPVAEANQANIPVFTIGLGNNADTDYLQEVALRTGGEFSTAPAADQLQAIYQSIADRLRQQYQLNYQSKVKADGQNHKLSVKAVTPRGEVTNETEFQAICPPGKPGLRLSYLKPSEVVGDPPEVVALPDGLEVAETLTVEPDISSCRKIVAVEYYLNDQLRTTVQTAPYHFIWNTADEGVKQSTAYNLTVKALDDASNVGEKSAVVNVSPPAQPPAPPLWLLALIGLTALLFLVLLIYALVRRRQSQSQPEPAYMAPVGPVYPSTYGEGSTVPELPSFAPGPPASAFDAATGTFGATAPEMPALGQPGFPSYEPAAPPPSKTMILDTKPPVMAWLVMERGDRPGQTFRLQSGDTMIGRLGTCDVALNDPAVSRQHAKIRKEGEDFAIYDLAATNPVLVNKQPVTRHLLVEGDRIELGNTVLVFKRVNA